MELNYTESLNNSFSIPFDANFARYVSWSLLLITIPNRYACKPPPPPPLTKFRGNNMVKNLNNSDILTHYMI